MMNDMSFFFPDHIFISGHEYDCQRSKNQILVPYTEEPNVGIGDVIIEKSGSRNIEFKVLDTKFRKKGTLGIGNHPHMLELTVENMTASVHKPSAQTSTFNIGSIAGEKFQVGNNNSQIVNISIQSLVEEVAKSGDSGAKNLLKSLLENATVGSLIGAGASALIGLLSH
jgi:hypothetical protein